MFKEQYDELNKQVAPTEELLRDTMSRTNKFERACDNKAHVFYKPATVLVAICLCLFLSMPALASTIEPIYRLMYMVSPTIAQFFMPVQRSYEDNGIKIEVVSTYIHDNIAEIYITMQDLIEQRIDATIDLFDSYSINRPFDSSAYCERIGYDENTKTATFLITIEEWGNQDISGDKITFTVRQFLSHKKTYDHIEIPVPLVLADFEPETEKVSHVTGGGGNKYEEYMDSKDNVIALVPKVPIEQFPIDGIELTGIGYIDGKLHIQTAVKDNLDKDNHGFFYLKDSNGNKVDCSYSFDFVNQYEQPGRIDYSNYVFDISQSEISNYTLHGYFVTSGMITKGNWEVTFPLE